MTFPLISILPGPGEDGEVRMRPSVSNEMDKRCACNRVVNIGMKNGRLHGLEVFHDDDEGKDSCFFRYSNKGCRKRRARAVDDKNVYDHEQRTGSRGQFSGIISRLPVGSCS